MALKPFNIFSVKTFLGYFPKIKDKIGKALYSLKESILCFLYFNIFSIISRKALKLFSLRVQG